MNKTDWVCSSVALKTLGSSYDLNFQSGSENLWRASSNGHVEIAKLLIDAGANVNKTNWVCGVVR